MDAESIVSIMQGECGLSGSRPVLLGISGGPDSLALLDLLAGCGYPLIAAHFDHKLRQGSGQEAEYVRSLAEGLGVPFLSGSMDVFGLASAKKWSLEEAARYARYTFLFQEARRVNAEAVAVAHTADDQVETVLMHILRGAGLAGLKGMAYRTLPNEWDERLPIVRPLLSTWREEILEYCERRELSPVMDPSNRDATFFRNRLRHHLIPVLQGYNPNLKQTLWRMSQVLAGDVELLEKAGDDAWQECLVAQIAVSICLDHAKVAGLPAGLQRRILRKAMGLLLQGERDIGFEAVERGRQFLALPSGSGRVELSGGLSLFSFGDQLIFAKSEADIPTDFWPQLQTPEELVVDIPFRVDLNQGWVLEGGTVSNAPPSLRVEDPNLAWVDADLIKLPLRIRKGQAGDRFQPLGMEGGRMKLSDFWVNQKIPRFARGNWPLIFSDDQVVWIPGQRLAHFCRLTPQTQKVLALRLIHEGGEPPGP